MSAAMSLGVSDLGAGHWVLVPLRNPPANQPVAVPTGVDVVLGRQRGLEIVCRGDKAVSARHCKLFHSRTGLVAEDMSTNGTHVNGEKISKGNKATLHHGDVLSITRPPDGPHGLVDDEYTQFRVEFREGGGLGPRKHKDSQDSPEKALHALSGEQAAPPAGGAADAGVGRSKTAPLANPDVQRRPVNTSASPPVHQDSVVRHSGVFSGHSSLQVHPAGFGVAVDPSVDLRRFYELQGAYKVLQEQHRELQEQHKAQGQRTMQLEQAQLQLSSWIDEAESAHWKTLRRVEELSQDLLQSEQRAGDAQAEARSLRAELEALQHRAAVREEQHLEQQRQLRESLAEVEHLKQTSRNLEEAMSQKATRWENEVIDRYVAEQYNVAGHGMVELAPQVEVAQPALAEPLQAVPAPMPTWIQHPQTELVGIGAHSKSAPPLRPMPVMPRLKELFAVPPLGGAGLLDAAEEPRGSLLPLPMPIPLPPPPAAKRQRVA